ncbi:3'(2'),5'-bisphosphate nucleotidase CysQ [Robiginitalea sp. SC105]|uniref:3'(2'),5'-bisphosphate nucleotidase CysQ n=1 Tax=Robiginitalea sp. SC105 TaxID=2762332 RepID=UPI00163AE792|nr:3'(2'),5'-bisphosphate nucleotidase CysQ [Robiginitalea sp. SC105]MBC2840315.1 3'(2'),5'-bisphosphate nucleotidase CysQ [Robiginitalea sp. SC105]
MQNKPSYQTAIEAAIEAGKAILEIYNASETIEVTTKSDDSPLTAADQASNAVINSYLKDTGIPIISEENKQTDYAVRKEWGKCWIVDPLDGTKEFIKKNGEFTVNIALCEEGSPIFGVIYVPVSRELFYGDTAMGMAFKSVLDKAHHLPKSLFDASDRITPSGKDLETLRVVGSRSHMNAETEAYINSMKKQFNHIEIVSKGSSLKFCLVAEGLADVYPRYAPTMEWDTAAGSAIAEAAGLQVIAQDTSQPLKYNKENLLNPHFLVCK